MQQLVTKPFPYFVGLYSLEELVTKDSRVCVINILGNESRKVTNVSHEYSGGNVVAGVQYGRRGVLETKIGDIPVYRSIYIEDIHLRVLSVPLVIGNRPIGTLQLAANLVLVDRTLNLLVSVLLMSSIIAMAIAAE